MTPPQLPDPFAIINRSSTVTIGGLPPVVNIGLQRGLDVWFDVKRTVKPGESSTCDLKLRNLSDPHRQQLEAAVQKIASQSQAPGSTPAFVPVGIEAGYVGNTSTIFAGNLRSAQTVLEDGDFVTEIECGDGDAAMLLARTSASFAAPCSPLVVATRLIADMGCGQGNLSTYSALLLQSPLYAKGGVLKGSSMDLLVTLARSCGLEVSLQRGILQWSARGQGVGGSAQAYVLSSSTGLYDSPSLDTKGVLHCKTAMLPGIQPGSWIQLNAKFVSGVFRVVCLDIEGDTRGEAWSLQIEAKRPGLAA